MEGVKKKTSQNPRGNVLIKAQEVTFVKALAGNNKPLRDRALKRLRKWFKARSQGTFQFVEDDFMRLWKGIFYSMWMSDKPLIQEELAESISDLIHAFGNPSQAVLFIKCFFVTMGLEWFGLDQLRLNKFQMLVRRFLRQSLEFARRLEWDAGAIAGLNAALADTVLCATGNYPLGLVTHFCDIFLEELAKVGGEDIPEEVVTLFLPPVIDYWCASTQPSVRVCLMTNIIDQLIHQSDIGLEHKARFTAWAQAGFPGDSMDDMQLVGPDSDAEPDEESDEEEPARRTDPRVMDPRAGHVDVVLPQIRFDPEQVARLFDAKRRTVEGKMRKHLAKQEFKFTELAAGRYPFAGRYRVKRSRQLAVMREEKGNRGRAVWEAAHDLGEFFERLDDRPLDEVHMPGTEKPPPQQQQAKRKKNPLDDLTDEERFQHFIDQNATIPRPASEKSSDGASKPKKSKLTNGSMHESDGDADNAEDVETAKCNSTSPRWQIETVASPTEPPKRKKLEATPQAESAPRSAGKNSATKHVTPPGDSLNGSTKKKTPKQSETDSSKKRRASVSTSQFIVDECDASPTKPSGEYASTPVLGSANGARATNRFSLHTPTDRVADLSSGAFPTSQPGSSGKKTGTKSPVSTTNLPKKSPGSTTPNVHIPGRTPEGKKNTPKSGISEIAVASGSMTITPKSSNTPANTPKSPAVKSTPDPKSTPNTPGDKTTPKLGGNIKTPGSKNTSIFGNANSRTTPDLVKTPVDIAGKSSPKLPKVVVENMSLEAIEQSTKNSWSVFSGSKCSAIVPDSVANRQKSPGVSGTPKGSDGSLGSGKKSPREGEGVKITSSIAKQKMSLKTLDELETSPKRLHKRKLELKSSSAKRRSLEGADQAENKVLTALVRQEAARRTSPRKSKGTAAGVARGADGDAKKQLAFEEEAEVPDKVAPLPKRLSLNMLTPLKSAAGKRQSLGSLLEGETAPASPKRMSLRLAQKTGRVKGRSPPTAATPTRSARKSTGLAANPLTLTPAEVLKTPGAKAALLTSAKRSVGGASTPGSAKKVNIALKHNVAQEVSEYHATLRQSPGIPYDAQRVPPQGVLKAASVRSPINPFYLLKENAKLNRLQPQPK